MIGGYVTVVLYTDCYHIRGKVLFLISVSDEGCSVFFMGYDYYVASQNTFLGAI